MKDTQPPKPLAKLIADAKSKTGAKVKYDVKTMCAVYGSVRHDEMYIYMPKNIAFDTLPEALRSRFGKPRKAMEILLIPGKTLARVSADKILEDFARQGFYLQLPPAEKENWLEAFRMDQASDGQQDGCDTSDDGS